MSMVPRSAAPAGNAAQMQAPSTCRVRSCGAVNVTAWRNTAARLAGGVA